MKRLVSIALTVLLAGVLAFADDVPKIGQNYPNPAKERTFVDVEFNSSEATITLSNILGEIIYVQKVPRSGTYTINVTEIPEGVYFYTLAADGQKVIWASVSEIDFLFSYNLFEAPIGILQTTEK